MKKPGPPPRRILIGASSYADARAALHLTRLLKAQSRTIVSGLLVEETTLNDLPRLGRQRVVTASGALRDVPTPEQVRRTIERDATAFQTALSELEGAASSLERRQGELAGILWDIAQEWDVLLFGHRETHAAPGQVVLITPPAETVSDAADLAEYLARAAGTTTLALDLPPEADGPGFAALLARLGRINCTAVVLDRSLGPIGTPDQLSELLSAARCPIVLVGSHIHATRPVSGAARAAQRPLRGQIDD